MRQGFVLWNPAYAKPENRSRLNPAGGRRPAWTEPPAWQPVPLRQNKAKPKTGHFTCYRNRATNRDGRRRLTGGGRFDNLHLAVEFA